MGTGIRGAQLDVETPLGTGITQLDVEISVGTGITQLDVGTPLGTGIRGAQLDGGILLDAKIVKENKRA